MFETTNQLWRGPPFEEPHIPHISLRSTAQEPPLLEAADLPSVPCPVSRPAVLGNSLFKFPPRSMATAWAELMGNHCLGRWRARISRSDSVCKCLKCSRNQHFFGKTRDMDMGLRTHATLPLENFKDGARTDQLLTSHCHAWWRNDKRWPPISWFLSPIGYTSRYTKLELYV